MMISPNKVYVNRLFNCATSDLFKWLVKPELIIQWFGPNQLFVVNVKTDVRVGGKYSIELKKNSSLNFFITGEYMKIASPYELEYTSLYEGLSNTPPQSTINIKIEELPNSQSQLFLVQEFELIPSDMAKRTKAWEHMFDTLRKNIDGI